MRLLFVMCATGLVGCQTTQHVSQSQAITIAERQLIATYGERTVASERPFTATLRNGKWEVFGSDSPTRLGGPLNVTVDARTGHAEMGPMLMTDPEKFEKMFGDQK